MVATPAVAASCIIFSQLLLCLNKHKRDVEEAAADGNAAPAKPAHAHGVDGFLRLPGMIAAPDSPTALALPPVPVSSKLSAADVAAAATLRFESHHTFSSLAGLWHGLAATEVPAQVSGSSAQAAERNKAQPTTDVSARLRSTLSGVVGLLVEVRARIILID